MRVNPEVLANFMHVNLQLRVYFPGGPNFTLEFRLMEWSHLEHFCQLSQQKERGNLSRVSLLLTTHWSELVS